MQEPFFPFTIGLPYRLIPRFRELDSETWFEADLVVTSKDSGVIKVYDIFCDVSGGRGEHLRDVPISGIGKDIAREIDARALHLANVEMVAQDRALHARRRETIVARIMAELATQ